MITKKQLEKLRPILGYHYTKDVLKILKERGVTNRKGTPYGSSMIRNVYNGLNRNEKIEKAIVDLWIEKMEVIERRNKLLGIDSKTKKSD